MNNIEIEYLNSFNPNVSKNELAEFGQAVERWIES